MQCCLLKSIITSFQIQLFKIYVEILNSASFFICNSEYGQKPHFPKNLNSSLSLLSKS